MTKATFLFFGCILAVFAQTPISEFRAKISGGGGPGGKCTGEVDVDEAVEIQIFGDTARMQTLGGQPATWKRLECTSPMPGTPTGFRFSGVDGRGRQTLVRNPNDGLGVAVIRIEDPQRGREGYTFDIEWTGGTVSNTYGNGGFNNGQNPNVGIVNNNGGFGNVGGLAPGQPAGIVDFAYAVHACQSALAARAYQTGYVSLVIWAANLQDNPGNADVIAGNATASPARGGSAIRVNYSCTVDASSGRVTDLQTR